VLGTDIIKINDHFTLNDVALVNKLRYNLLSVSQLVDADLDMLFRKSVSCFDSSRNLACGISLIGKVFQVDFSFAQSSMKCLISQSSCEL
jgi:ABC-type antimicrobial peptide transport system ATPase subunit